MPGSLDAAIFDPAESGSAGGQAFPLPYLMVRGASRAPWSKRRIRRAHRPLLGCMISGEICSVSLERAGPGLYQLHPLVRQFLRL